MPPLRSGSDRSTTSSPGTTARRPISSGCKIILNLSHDPDTSADVAAALDRQADVAGEDIRRLLRDALGTEADPATMNAVFNAIRGTALSRQITDATPDTTPRTTAAAHRELSILLAWSRGRGTARRRTIPDRAQPGQRRPVRVIGRRG